MEDSTSKDGRKMVGFISWTKPGLEIGVSAIECLVERILWGGMTSFRAEVGGCSDSAQTVMVGLLALVEEASLKVMIW